MNSFSKMLCLGLVGHGPQDSKSLQQTLIYFTSTDFIKRNLSVGDGIHGKVFINLLVSDAADAPL